MSLVVPFRSHGPTRYSVRDFAAVGDGIHDDTLAFQCAIDFLPKSGGTVFVPAGTYLIDAEKSVRLRSNMKLEMEDGAVLMTKPNSNPRTNTILIEGVEDVEVCGGAVFGDRLTHTYTVVGNSTDTHEWGHGIRVRQSKRVTVRDIKLENCTGDGISIAGDDIVLYRVVSTQCRRQGLTCGSGTNYKVWECEFLKTGNLGDNLGTKPMAGVDLEPDAPGVVDGVEFVGCKVFDNVGSGIIAYNSSAVLDNQNRNRNISIKGCEFGNNAYGVETIRVMGLVVEDCLVLNTRYTGIRISNGSIDVVVSNNTLGSNYTRGVNVIPPRDPAFDLTGTAKIVERDIVVTTGTTNVKVLTNRYV